MDAVFPAPLPLSLAAPVTPITTATVAILCTAAESKDALSPWRITIAGQIASGVTLATLAPQMPGPDRGVTPTPFKVFAKSTR